MVFFCCPLQDPPRDCLPALQVQGHALLVQVLVLAVVTLQELVQVVQVVMRVGQEVALPALQALIASRYPRPLEVVRQLFI